MLVEDAYTIAPSTVDNTLQVPQRDDGVAASCRRA
jgi:hypothetical protein